MAATTTTTVDDFLLAAALEDKISEALRDQAIMASLVYNVDMRGKNSKVCKLPKGSTVSAAGLTEGTDMSSTAYSDNSAVSITMGEVGVQVAVTDLTVEAGIANLDHYVSVAANAVTDKRETDLTALFSGFSQSVGVTTAELSLDKLLQAIYLWRAGKSRGQPVGVLHPRQVHAFRTLIFGTSGSTATVYGSGIVRPDLATAAGYSFSWAGVDWYESAAVPTANAGADYLGALFSAEAIAMATLWDIRVEPQRDASLRALELNCTSVYGVGEYHDTMGIGILSKVAL